jgi:hypothetical protein
VAASFVSHESTELSLVVIVAGLALISSLVGYRRHRRHAGVLPMFAGLVLVLAGRVVELSTVLEVSTAGLGSALLIGVHFHRARSIYHLGAHRPEGSRGAREVTEPAL